MMLMPPTNATSRSTAHSFWCRRRNWPGCSKLHQRSTGRNTASSTFRLRHHSAQAPERGAWSRSRRRTTHTRTPRRAPAQPGAARHLTSPHRRRGRCRSTARPRDARQRSPRASAGKSSSPPCSSSARGCRAENCRRATTRPLGRRSAESSLRRVGRRRSCAQSSSSSTTGGAGGLTCVPAPRRAAASTTGNESRACRRGRGRTPAPATGTWAARRRRAAWRAAARCSRIGAIEALAPVVEVAGHQQRCPARHELGRRSAPDTAPAAVGHRA